MKDKYIIKKQEEFNEIIKNGHMIKGKTIILYYAPSIDNKKYFGIAAGKKIGNAVSRNLSKRRVRMLLNKYQNLFSNKYKYIIMLRSDCLDYPYNIWENDLKECIGKVE